MDDYVLALTVVDDGTGPALYVGGYFTTAGGVPANKIAKWDGAQWSTLGSGMDGPIVPGVFALTVFDDGTGPALCVGGRFTVAGGTPANSIAKWDGMQWSSLSSGVDWPFGPHVGTLAVFDDGTGTALYAGGRFTTAGGTPANNIAKWNGMQWSSLGSGTEEPPDPAVGSLAVFHDGTGPALYAGGPFGRAGGVQVNSIAKWHCVMP
jgi:hypothetical protein